MGGGGTRAARGDTSSSGGGGCSSSSNSGGNSSNSSGEEEWQDDGMDFSSKRDANPDAQEDRRKGGRGELTAGGRRRKVGTTRAAPTRGARAAARDRIFPAAVGGVEEYSSDSDGVGKGEDGADDMEELDDDEIAAMERVPTPPPPLSPGGECKHGFCPALVFACERCRYWLRRLGGRLVHRRNGCFQTRASCGVFRLPECEEISPGVSNLRHRVKRWQQIMPLLGVSACNSPFPPFFVALKFVLVLPLPHPPGEFRRPNFP